MKFKVFKRFSGEVGFTANIECEESQPSSIKLGLAVKWAVENNANLSDANLSGADLSGTDLRYANLSGTDLSGADLRGADLSGTDLRYANLSGADLSGTDLRYANLSGTDLSGADLRGADLRGAKLWGVNSGINAHIKSIQIATYNVSYTSEIIQIGCEQHSIDEWREFGDDRIINMDGKKALEFWRKYKEFIFTAIELAPAEKTTEK